MKLETIGQNIKKHRLKKKLRQEELAELTGLSPNYIGMIERGEKIPALDTFVMILNALEISSDMVLAEILSNGYVIKNSILNDKLAGLSIEDRERIYDVTETLIKHSK